jgi:hypothetical protein
MHVGRGRKRPEGKCRVCGTFGPLSWEHVPPEAAYNDHQVVMATQEQKLASELWDGKRGQVQQRGSGAYTLCERCNNNTGTWYGAEYVRWSKQGLERLLRIPSTEERPFFVPFRGRPLRFLKQVVAMFFSVNNDSFASLHPELVRFVLNRESTGLPPAYKVDLVLVRGGFARGVGIYGATNLATGATDVASEVAHYPFALKMQFGDGGRQRHGAIEQFARCGFNEEREVWLYTIAGHVVTKYPGDYRSKERVEREAATSTRETRE